MEEGTRANRSGPEPVWSKSGETGRASLSRATNSRETKKANHIVGTGPRRKASLEGKLPLTQKQPAGRRHTTPVRRNSGEKKTAAESRERSTEVRTPNHSQGSQATPPRSKTTGTWTHAARKVTSGRSDPADGQGCTKE